MDDETFRGLVREGKKNARKKNEPSENVYIGLSHSKNLLTGKEKKLFFHVFERLQDQTGTQRELWQEVIKWENEEVTLDPNTLGEKGIINLNGYRYHLFKTKNGNPYKWMRYIPSMDFAQDTFIQNTNKFVKTTIFLMNLNNEHVIFDHQFYMPNFEYNE